MHVCIMGACMLSKYLRPYVSAGPVMGHRVQILLFYVVFLWNLWGWVVLAPSMHLCIHVSMDACIHVSMYRCIYVFMCVM